MSKEKDKPTLARDEKGKVKGVLTMADLIQLEDEKKKKK